MAGERNDVVGTNTVGGETEGHWINSWWSDEVQWCRRRAPASNAKFECVKSGS